MPIQSDFDVTAAHRFFSADCFNRTWGLIDKMNRSPQEDQEMILLSTASLWHWTQREDCTPTNLSVGYWQLSRVYAAMGQAENARHYAHLCLDCSRNCGVAPFFLGYAYEALARAEAIAENLIEMGKYLEEARRQAARVSEEADREQLLGDLDTIR
jgi:hypothetical protein